MVCVCQVHSLYMLHVYFCIPVLVLCTTQFVHIVCAFCVCCSCPECSIKTVCTCCMCTVCIVSCTIFYAVFVQVVCTVYTVSIHSMWSVVAVHCGRRQPGSPGCVPAQGHAPSSQEPGRTMSGHPSAVPLSSCTMASFVCLLSITFPFINTCYIGNIPGANVYRWLKCNSFKQSQLFNLW